MISCGECNATFKTKNRLGMNAQETVQLMLLLPMKKLNAAATVYEDEAHRLDPAIYVVKL